MRSLCSTFKNKMYQRAGFSSLLFPLFLRLHLKRFLHCILYVRLPNGRKLSLGGRRSFRIATLRSLSRAHSDMPVSRIICSFCLDFHFFKCLCSCFASPKRVLFLDFSRVSCFSFIWHYCPRCLVSPAPPSFSWQLSPKSLLASEWRLLRLRLWRFVFWIRLSRLGIETSGTSP